jgi:circadian clock protein KaiC
MNASSPMPRVSTGVTSLDESIEGGLPPLRVTLVTGPAGAGKTTLALQFLAGGLRAGENGIFIALDQKPGHVAESAARFGWPVDAGGAAPAAGASIFVLDGSPALSLMRQHALDARAVMSDLIPHLRACAARRLVIDALPGLVPPGLSEADESAFLRDLVFALEDNLGCTTIVVGPDGDPRAARISSVMARLATGVIDVRARETDGRLARYLLVRKMRATIVDAEERAFAIGTAGAVMIQP